ncbi:hypothetical protein JCGZ_25552 [Jatropha curcas]|uniref:Uncharacterized protein n=2 Tax=Jatropha curcas TaxID=180498 RepID=A0A067JKY1_JATCU|nr:hypothetical protein JCGZ_25552 [Jatropha curcas]
MEMNRLIDYGVESNELMQLVVQGVTNHQDGNGRQEVAGTALTGWNERLRSPRKKIENGNVHMSSNLASIDQSTPVSEELSTIASYQFSDMCFSIDLMKSSSSQDQKSQAKEDIEKVVPETEEKIPGKFQEQRNKPVFNPLYKAPENWLNEVSLLADEKLGQNHENMKLQVKDQSIKSNSARWRKLISCCYHSRYQQCSKSFKNGGL